MNGVFDDIRNSFKRTDNGLNQLIIINISVFILLTLTDISLYIAGREDIYHLISGWLILPPSFGQWVYKPWTLVTYSFTHTDFFHILFNMLNLYWFGIIIHDFLGSKKIINIYLLGALAGGLFFLLAYSFIPFFADRNISGLLGASAGVFAVMVAAATLAPDYTFFMLFFGAVRIKYLVMVLFFLYSIVSFKGNPGGSLAHIGGALMGFLYIRQLRSGYDLGKPILWLTNTVGKLFKSSSHIRVTHRKHEMAGGRYEDPSQDEIDEILDKISRNGYEKLTKEEKQKLFKASQK